MKKADLIPVIAVLLLAAGVALLFIGKESDTVRITCGSGVYEYPLDTDRTVELDENGIRLTVVIKDGSVRVAESTCRDKICVHTHSDRIVCLPAQVVITVVKGEYDHVAG